MKRKIIKPSNTLEKVLSQFSEDQIGLMMGNIGAIQLTEGCSIGCYFCGFEAKKGLRDYIPFGLIEKLVERYSAELGESKPMLYYASDPFDYDFDGHDYVEVSQLVERKCDYKPWISTTVPHGKEDLVIRLLQERDEEKINRIKKLKKELVEELEVIIEKEADTEAFKEFRIESGCNPNRITYGDRIRYENYIRNKY